MKTQSATVLEPTALQKHNACEQQGFESRDTLSRTTSILLVENGVRSAGLLTSLCKDGLSKSFQLSRVNNVRRAAELLKSHSFSVILLELTLDDSVGLDTLYDILGVVPFVPVIVLTKSIDQRLALRVLQAGAQDYLTLESLERDHEQELTLSLVIYFAIERKRIERRLTYLAHHDSLTGLENRVSFRDRLQRALERSERTNKRVGLLFLDLDRFKKINDTLGHEAGDDLLKQVALRLRESVRSWETVARLAGDEFVVILENLQCDETQDFDAEVTSRIDTRSLNKRDSFLSSYQNNIEIVEGVACRILQAMAQPFILAGEEHSISTSIGVAISAEGDSIDSFIERADQAMYKAKNAGRDTYAIQTYTEVDELLEVEQVEESIATDQFSVVYKIKVENESQDIIELEAIPCFDNLGLGTTNSSNLMKRAEVVEWFVQQSCHQAADLMSYIDSPWFLSFTISRQQYEKDEFCDVLMRGLRESDFSPERVNLLIDENVLFTDFDLNCKLLGRFKQLGFSITLSHCVGRLPLIDLIRYPLNMISLDASMLESLEYKALLSATLGVTQHSDVKLTVDVSNSQSEYTNLSEMDVEVRRLMPSMPFNSLVRTWSAGFELDQDFSRKSSRSLGRVARGKTRASIV